WTRLQPSRLLDLVVAAIAIARSGFMESQPSRLLVLGLGGIHKVHHGISIRRYAGYINVNLFMDQHHLPQRRLALQPQSPLLESMVVTGKVAL
ncbi:hypothetical protein BGZ50_001208, partial [Haplosporangium sp. Z 11]